MVQFTTTILRFTSEGEKTGWAYLKIPVAIAHQLKPENRRSFRVKGIPDAHQIKGVSLLPMGAGDFIIAMNAVMRKAIKKNQGAKVLLQMEVDNKKPQPC